MIIDFNGPTIIATWKKPHLIFIDRGDGPLIKRRRYRHKLFSFAHSDTLQMP